MPRATSEPGDHFGQSVAISRDGSFIAVGADGYAKGSGAVYVLLLNKKSITGLPRIPAYKNLGISLSISTDGKTIITGSYGKDNSSGAIVGYCPGGASWDSGKARITFLTPKANGMLLGFNLDVTDDGSRMLFGAPLASGGQGGFFWSNLQDKEFEMTK